MKCIYFLLLSCVVTLCGCASSPHKAELPPAADMTASSGKPAPAELSLVDEVPIRLFMPDPQYPKGARKDGIEGTVMVKVLVGKDGRVKQTVLARSIDALNSAAVSVARQAVFEPARKAGQPVEVWVMMPITFKLRDPVR